MLLEGYISFTHGAYAMCIKRL